MTEANDNLRLRHELCMRVVDYQEALTQLLTVVEDDAGRVHRYYTRDAGITLNLIAADIRRMASALGDEGMDAWLEQEKRRKLSGGAMETPSPQHVQPAAAPSPAGRKALWAAGAAAAVLAGWQLVSYAVSGDDRARFDESMATAQQALDSGDYEDAIEMADNAADSYASSFMNGSYKDRAHAVARSASDKILDSWLADVRRFLSAGRPELAKARTQRLPATLKLEGDAAAAFEEACGEIERSLAARCEAFVEQLIAESYSNGGHISAASHKELQGILEVMPDHYWLNYFNDRANEK